MEINLTKDKAEALKSLLGDKVTIVRFTAKWCGPCRMIKPVFEQLATENEDTKFIVVDVDENKEVPTLYEVRSIPHIVALDSENNVINTKTGATSLSAFQMFIDDAKAHLLNK